MKRKLFGIEKSEYHRKLWFLGIGFKFRSKKLMSKKIQQLEQRLGTAEYNARSAARWNVFLWSNEGKFTAQDYEWYVASHFYEQVGYYPDLKNPQTLSEKLSWLKLHYRHPDYSRICDKLEFKKYIAEKLGEGCTARLLGVWDDPAEIDFDSLPQRFVLKITAGGGGTYGVKVVQDKEKLDRDEVRYLFHEWTRPWMKAHYYEVAEPRDIRNRIIAEEYLEDEPGCGYLTDYKFFCVHGEPQFYWVDVERYGSGHRRNVYDCSGNQLPVQINYPHFNEDIKPHHLETMLELARRLSSGFSHIRVDFYESNERVYVGEMTFHSEGSNMVICPREFDSKWGEVLNIDEMERDELFDTPGPNAKPFTGPLPGERLAGCSKKI